MVDTGHRLVEHKDVRYRGEGQPEQDALQLAAGKGADLAVDQLAGTGALQAVQRGLPHRSRDTEARGARRERSGEEIEHTDRSLFVEAVVLGHVTDDRAVFAPAGRVEKMHFTGVRQFTEQTFDQRGLARPVFADHRGQLAAVQMEVDILEHRHSIAPRSHTAHGRATLSAAVRRDAVMGGGVIRRNVHADRSISARLPAKPPDFSPWPAGKPRAPLRDPTDLSPRDPDCKPGHLSRAPRLARFCPGTGVRQRAP